MTDDHETRCARPTAAAEAAVRYWRVACALASAHLFGWTWPPTGTGQRERIVGHWGCNPGIAWVTGHLAAHWDRPDPAQLVVGTGHASSFCFAHNALSDQFSPAEITDHCGSYGMPGGAPAELLSEPGLVFAGGQLGPGLGVAQGLAAALPGESMVWCVVGDGECETPLALAAIAHATVLLDPAARRRWLPVINANGARMGAASRFSAAELRGLLRGFGYHVVVSGEDPEDASAAAGTALAWCRDGRLTAWVSATDKGWPAPAVIAGAPYRMHHAHKAPGSVRGGKPLPVADTARWLAQLGVAPLLGPGGALPADTVALARRVSLRGPTLPRRPAAVTAANQPWPAPEPLWRAPMRVLDLDLAESGTRVLCPDEASSNGLLRCASAGLVTEVLSEELCAAWAWGQVEAGRPVVLATYEAFAPLTSSIVAQYLKLTSARPPRGSPPLLILSTSLGWANTPTHQNTDLTSTLLARPLSGVAVAYPVGATSARHRLRALLNRLTDGVALLSCSKQTVLDLPDPDPGAPMVSYRISDAPPAATLITIGDICATEAIAAANLAEHDEVPVEVIAIIDLPGAVPALAAHAARLADRPVILAAWCAPRHVAGLVWEGLGRVVPVLGYQERWGPTAAQTLRANQLDRHSLLRRLSESGVGPLRPHNDLDTAFDRHLGPGVPEFVCPELIVHALSDQEGSRAEHR